jgi:hypothetical protein
MAFRQRAVQSMVTDCRKRIAACAPPRFTFR